MKPPEHPNGRLGKAAHTAAQRDAQGRRDPEPSLGRRLGQIGLLGWMIVIPLLVGLALGRWLDGLLGTGVMFAAALIFVGACFGLWSAWRWMHRQ